jgi:hypothetical protein
MNLITKAEKKPWFFFDQETMSILVTGDWHVGDKYGILPKNPVTKEGSGIRPSNTQKRIYSDLVKTLKTIGHVDLLLIMGDTCEGKQLSSFGVPLNDADTDNQVNWAAELYQETFYDINSPDKVISVMGTPYHVMVGIGGNLDYQVAQKISTMSETYFGYPNAQFYLGKGKLLWDLQHRVSIASVNRLMPFEKTIRTYAVNVANDGGEVPDVIGRGHNHSICYDAINVSDGAIPRIAFNNACLKADDIYGLGLPYPTTAKVGVTTMRQEGRIVTGRKYLFNLYGEGAAKI